MIIGNFIYDADNDTYAGSIATLTVVHHEIRIRPAEKSGEKGPDYRMITETAFGTVELGAAWKRTSDNGRDYLAVLVDDPCVSAPLNAALFLDEDGKDAALVWNRQKPKAATEPQPAATSKPKKKAA